MLPPLFWVQEERLQSYKEFLPFCRTDGGIRKLCGPIEEHILFEPS